MICDNISLESFPYSAEGGYTNWDTLDTWDTCGSTEMSTQAVSGLSLLGMRSTGLAGN